MNKFYLLFGIIFLFGVISSSVPVVIINLDADTLDDLSCSTNQIPKWNGSLWQCQSDIGNSTAEIWTVVYNNTFVDWGSVPVCVNPNKLIYNGSHITCVADIDTWNSTSDFWNIANNGSLTRYNGWYNSSLINTTHFQEVGGKLEIKESWFTSLWNTIFGTKTTDDLTQGTTNLYQNKSFNESRTNTLYLLVGNWNATNASYYLVSNPFAFWNDSNNRFNKTYADTLYVTVGTKLGNYSSEIWAIADNGTFIKFTDLPLANRTTISWKNVTDFPTCSGGTNLFFNGSHLNCTTSSGGTDTWAGNMTNYYNKTDSNTTIWQIVNNGTMMPVAGGNFTGNVNYTNSNITLSNSWIKNSSGQAYIYYNGSGWVIRG